MDIYYPEANLILKTQFAFKPLSNTVVSATKQKKEYVENLLPHCTQCADLQQT
jgi:hypothetical protein